MLSDAQRLDASLFAQSLFAHDRELLTRFYRSAARIRRIRERHNIHLIPQDQLDDLLLTCS